MLISELFSTIINDTTACYYILSILITTIAMVAAYLYTNKKKLIKVRVAQRVDWKRGDINKTLKLFFFVCVFLGSNGIYKNRRSRR